MLTSVLTLLLAAVATAAPVALELAPRATCYDGVYVIGARGSEEDAGYGSVETLVDNIVAAIPNSGSIALDYPASVVLPIYSSSVTDGINALITLIENYVDDCGGNIVLTGYSQGGNVITDAMSGGTDKPTPLSTKYAKYVTAITVFGDPTFTAGQSFDVGTDTTSNGIFARGTGSASLALLNTYASKIQSYCNTGDVFCASGIDTDVHGEEVSTYMAAALAFSVSKN